MAEQRADEARAAQLAAEQARAELLRLSDGKRLDDLRAEAETLWPVHPDLVPDLERWIESAEDICGNLTSHREALVRLRGRAVPAPLDSSEPRFDQPEDAWWYEKLHALVADLEALADPDPAVGVLASMRERLERSRTIERRSVLDHEEAWDDAVFSVSELEVYSGLELAAQIGLVPLDQDTESGLWEFLVVESGEAPEVDPETGRWAVTDATGIVLILLPGGRFSMGAQAVHPGEPNYDPQAAGNERPVQEVSLDPFFLSKYELTQAQWERTGLANPSDYQKRLSDLGGGNHPVEQVSWHDPSVPTSLRH
jgi:hypothetical protein